MTVDFATIAGMIDHGFHTVVFQPIRCLDSQTVFGFEALMRGPVGSPMAMPGPVFRNAAVDRDLLHRLDLACLLSAVRMGRVFPEDRLVFLNMHGETLLRLAHGAHDVERLLSEVGLPFSRIVLEVSELTDRSHVRSIGRSLKRFRREGMRVALDDVGSRYAWLHHMLWLEPEYIKIDRQFIRRINHIAHKQRLLASLVQFSKGVGSEIIAEGIETAGELEIVIGAGVPLGQGYFLGRPLPVQSWMPETEEMAERARVAGLVTMGSLSV